ncbi:MAG: AMP-binding protein [Rhodobacteraceae bacterium]|nr:AMP-binding protein [Paracoccaceae bacterium]
MTRAASPAALLAQQAQVFGASALFVIPAAVADLWGEARRTWTYAEAQAEVETLRAAYRAAGFGPGHRVALLLENRPAHFLHWLALNGLGVCVVPLNPDAAADELAWILAHSDAGLIVTLSQRRDQVAGLGVPVLLDGDTPPAVPAAGDGGQHCALIYTSGTSGRPKGCQLSDAYFMAWADWYLAQPEPIALRPGRERLLTPMPCFHVNAMGNSFMGMLASGGAQIIVDRFHPRQWWDTAIETGATCFHYLGVMPAMLLNLPPAPHDRAHGLRFGSGGGVHPDNHAAFEARFGVPLIEGWAMTETGGACILSSLPGPRHVGTRCIGRADRPGPKMEVRLIDGLDRELVGEGEGEMCVRAAGPDPTAGLFSGYLKDPVATDAAWQDGWLRTGDVVRRGPDGALHFVDRRRNVIRRSGENIAALEVEGVLASHPDVAQVVVVALPDPVREEEVMAVVVPQAGTEGGALARALFAHCADKLAYFKVPGLVMFRDALPVTSTQKMRRVSATAFAANPLTDPRAHDFRAEKQGLRRQTTPAHAPAEEDRADP